MKGVPRLQKIHHFVIDDQLADLEGEMKEGVGMMEEGAKQKQVYLFLCSKNENYVYFFNISLHSPKDFINRLDILI